MTTTNEHTERAKAILAALDSLKDDAAAHIFPSDLEKCSNSECAVTVYSVRMGNPTEKTVPLFSREQVAAALLEAQYEPAGERVGEPRYTHAQIVELCRDHPLHVADHIQWLYKKSGVSKQQLSAIVNAAGTYALTIRSLNTEHQARSQRAKFEAELSAILEVQRPALKPSVFLQNIHHAYAQLDGTYAWPNSREGDMLKQAKTEIESAHGIKERA